MAAESPQQQLDDLPTAPGVYIFRDASGNALYVGKSIRLRERVRSYFHDSADLGERTRQMVDSVAAIDHIQTETELEALLLEADLIKRLKPEYNIQWRDDKRYKYIEIVKAAWPRVTTSRRRDGPNSLYFGPFPEGQTVNRVLKTLRKIFPWCKYKDEAVLERAGRPCFYYHIQQCPGICAGKITLEEYWDVVNDLVEFLSGGKRDLIEKYQHEMRSLASAQKFEQAADVRDKIKRLEYITQQFRESSEYLENPNLLQDLREQEIRSLVQHLTSNIQPKMLNANVLRAEENFRIEGYDISNISADHTVGSRVVFIGGEPDKSQYRRYKIQLEDTPDDMAAIREVLQRRFKSHTPDTPDHPDLLLIDGGKGQLSAALEVLAEKNLAIPVIGLAKKEESLIVLSDANIGHPMSDIVNLPHDSPALHLLQRVRDEAHRFARAYHQHLRSKASTSKM